MAFYEGCVEEGEGWRFGLGCLSGNREEGEENELEECGEPHSALVGLRTSWV